MREFLIQFLFLSIGALSIMAFVCLSLFVAQATILKKRSWLFESLFPSSHYLQPSFKIRAYLWIVVGALFACIYGGYETLLWWIPDSWGSHGEDGDWTSLRSYIASIATAFVGYGFILIALGYIEYSRHNHFLRIKCGTLELENTALQKLFDSAGNKLTLEHYRTVFTIDLERCKVQDLTDSNLYPELSEYPDLKLVKQNLTIEAYKRLILAVDEFLKRSQ